MAYPTCSVIIATCDRPDQLRRSIASVIGQTVRPAELIVVDDCSVSPAKSPVAERTGVGFEIRYHRLMERSGASAARNAGARHRARRNYHVPGRRGRTFWEPHKIETQLGMFARHAEAGTVYTGMLAVDDTDRGRVLHASTGHLSGGTWPQILFRNFVGPTPSAMMAIRSQALRSAFGRIR